MANELTVFKAQIVRLEIEGHKLRSVEGTDMVFIRDILDTIGVKKTAWWINELIIRSTGDKLNVHSTDIKVKYYDINEANPGAFTNTPGIIEILAGSRKPKAKDILRAIIDKLRAKAITPVMPVTIDTLEALKIIIDSQLAMKAEIQSVKQDIAEVKADIAELKAGKEDVLLLRPIMDVSGEVRLLINDWVKANQDNPLVTHETVHARLNLVFLYAHRRNISKLGQKYNKSALQTAIDLGMGQEMLTLIRELVEHNFYGHFNE